MATQLQIRRGTAAQVAAFTGAEGEIVYNSTNDSLHTNDGSTAGGFELARADGANFSSSVSFTTLSAATFSVSGAATFTGEITANGGISLVDNKKLTFGTGDDLEVYHDGFNSYINDVGTGNIFIRGANVVLTTGGGTKYLEGGSNVLRLYHTGNQKMQTSAAGISVTGTVTADGIDVTGAITASGEIAANGGIALGDNDTATFGASDDLRIYHQAADNSSYIRELGAGNLKILGDNVQIMNAAGTENQIFSASDGAVTLYHNGSAKITSTATGIDVTGTATMDGLNVSGQTIISSAALVATPSTYYDELVVQNSASGTGAGITILVNATNGYGGVKFGDSTNSNQFGIGFDANANTGFLDVLGGQALTIDSSRNIGIGTAVPKRLLHLNNAGASSTKIQITNSSTGATTDGDGFQIGIGNDGTANIEQRENLSLNFSTNNTTRMTINSAGLVGIGVSNPTTALHVNGAISLDYGNGVSYQGIKRTSVGNEYYVGTTSTGTNEIHTFTGSSAVKKMVILESGSVGIGTASPQEKTHSAGRILSTTTYGASTQRIGTSIGQNGNTRADIDFRRWTGAAANHGVGMIDVADTGVMAFYTDSKTSNTPATTERMRISGGNVLVGKSGTAFGSNGIELRANGALWTTVTGQGAASFNIKGTDGVLVDFYKDGTTVGSIGTVASAPYYAGASKSLRIGSAGFYPATNTGAYTDGTIDLGSTSGGARYKDLHLSGNANVGGLDVTGTTTGSGYLYLSSKTANQGLRLNNTTKIQAWNPAGTVLRSLMQLDANEDVRIGSSANDIYLDNDTTVTGATTINANVASPLTVNANLNGIAYNEVFNVNAGANAAAYFGIVTLNLANTGTIRSGMFFDSSNHLNFINGEAGGAGIVLHDNNAVTMSGSLSVAGKYNITRGDITIAAGAITPTTSYVRLDTQASAATDDLDTINGGVIGDIVILETRISSRDVVVKDGTGNLGLAGGADFTLVNKSSTITLIYDGTSWLEMSRSSN